jgi:hypothetical protein
VTDNKESKSVASSSETSKVTAERLRLYYPVLDHINVERNEIPDDSDDEEPQRFYDVALQPITDELSKRLALALCIFTAGQKIKETKIFEVQAVYMIAVNAGPDAKAVLEQLSKSAAWPMFRSLFIHIGSQSGLEIPLLPNVPKRRWVKPDELIKTEG